MVTRLYRWQIVEEGVCCGGKRMNILVYEDHETSLHLDVKCQSSPEELSFLDTRASERGGLYRWSYAYSRGEWP